MEPLTGALAGKAVDSLFRALGRLGDRNRAEKLAQRALSKRNTNLPEPSAAERRRLERFFALEETWSLLIATSVEVSPELVRGIEACFSGDRDAAIRRSMAADFAELAISELPASLDPDDRVVLSSYQNRHLSDQVREIRELVSEYREPKATTSLSADLAEYRRQLQHAITWRRPTRLFPLTFRDNEAPEKPLGVLPEVVAAHRQVAIHAKAGSGKSAALIDLASRLNSSENALVVFVDLKPWAHERNKQFVADGESPTVDQILEASAVPATAALIQGIHGDLVTADARQYWLVDGINELPSGLSRPVLESLTTYLRGIVRSSLVVTDRSPTRYSPPEWSLLEINPLRPTDVDLLLPSESANTSEANSRSRNNALEDSGRRQLLTTPFFLDVAMTDGRWTWETSVQAIHGMFGERLSLSEDDIDKLADFALAMYTKREGLTFPLHELVATAGPLVARRLIESRVLLIPDDDSAAFYHQLLHDYLASRSLAKRPDAWAPKYFDALSFDANTYESLIMVLDQIQSEEGISDYITALYDWNWFGTIRCVERALRDDWRLPRHLTVVLSAMLGEKRFDPVNGSRARAEQWTEKLDGVTGFRFGQASAIAALVEEVERISDGSGPSWFRVWYGLFRQLKELSRTIDEVTVSEISNPDPFIGWTATQVARHCDLGLDGARQIRAMYRGARHASDDISRSIRWRAVHALGRHPSSENAQLLLEAIDSDVYSWVVYGAVRSLLEMAALSDVDATDRFLSQVDARLAQLPAEPLSQVAWATQYEGASAHWADRVWPLLEHARDLQETEEGKELWKARLEAFKTWWERESS
ncbi:hypothetical protein AB0F93_15410 [Micromonospora tulbaghiae]|uniref:hypothetical protein n=1 Tax=Micromonospora tulbaghiae TaxID=479978 RepID=UPI00332D031B